MKEIQGKLASMLDLELEESTVAERASRIHQRLKGKKVLVILDDLWDKLNLEEVGVPFGCKILLTSRFGGVLTSMGTRTDFKLGALEEEEAWRLFEEKAGSILNNSDFRNIGMQVARRCQGLPVLIVTVAASLSKRPELHAWNDALNQLTKMNNKEMHDIVNSAIESISYNHLENSHKQLFLLCGVLGGVASIEELLNYSLGWDLLNKEAVKIQRARDRLHALIFDLKESCLLHDDVDSKNSIRMHDVVRDVAISIGSKDSNMLSIREYDAELNICSKDADLKNCLAMVLRGCPNLPGLPSHLECPSLELFVVSGRSWSYSPSIPESFFEKTIKLKVLGMSRLGFSRLPPSLSFLKNLQTLRVDDCISLRDISVVGELKKLQTLNLAVSGIKELPSGIGRLSELRLLDVKGCWNLNIIPAGLIKGLTRLEELYVHCYFKMWEAEESSVKINASLGELKHLHNLSSLEIAVGDDKLVPEDLGFEKLKRYEIIVGDQNRYHERWFDYIQVTRKLFLQLSATTNSINHLQHGVKRLFESISADVECLCLGDLKGIKNVTPALDGDGFPSLKHLGIHKDYEIQYLVGVEDKTVFPYLESLHLMDLVKLHKICNGTLMKESFRNLTILEVSNCNRLESLFSFSMAIGLPRLQEIKVSNCDALEAIVAEKNVKDDINDGVCEKIEFAQLRKLSLECLPKLNTFFSNELKSSLPFFTKVSFPMIEELMLSEISNLTEIWSHKFKDTSCFCNLTTLTVKSCKSLKYIFPTSMAQSLTNKLEYLRVKYCEEMETIISDEHVAATFMFPKLTVVYLKKLPKLECLYPMEHTIKCPALSTFYVVDCDRLSTFSFRNIPKEQGDDKFEKEMSNSKEMCLRSSDLTKILRLYGDFPRHLFSSLETLVIVKFHGGSVDFLSKFLSIIPNQLQTFRVCNCSFQEIFLHANDHILPQLKWLEFSELPQLKYIYKHDHYSPLILNILDGLEFMEVKECPHLISLVPPSVSFRCLEVLTVNDCDGLTNLIQPSTATSLEQLKMLRISGCKMMEMVIGDDDDDDDEDDDDIIFPSLLWLELERLPRLTNFCSSPNYALNFPKLSYVIVRECPNMETFCGGITTTPKLNKVEYKGEECWKGDLNATVQQIFAETEAEGNALVHDENPIAVQIRRYASNATESRKGAETCEKVTGEGKEGGICFKAIRIFKRKTGKKATGTNEKGKEKEVSENSRKLQEIGYHLDSSRNFTAQEQTVGGYVASSSKPSTQSEEAKRPDTLSESGESQLSDSEVSDDSIGSNKGKEDGICVSSATIPDTRKGKGKEVEVYGEVMEHSGKVQDITRHSDPSTRNYIGQEQIVAGSVASSSKLSTHFIEEVPENSAKAQNDATDTEKMADTFEEGSLDSQHVVASSEETNPHAQTSFSLSTEMEVRRWTWNHSEIKSPRRSVHFIPLLSEFLQIIQNQPLKSMNAEHVQFMEDAFRDLYKMNFSIEWFIPYVEKARECLPVLESRREISELQSEIAKMEAELEAVKEKKKALEEKYESVASRIDLDKSLHDS